MKTFSNLKMTLKISRLSSIESQTKRVVVVVVLVVGIFIVEIFVVGLVVVVVIAPSLKTWPISGH